MNLHIHLGGPVIIRSDVFATQLDSTCFERLVRFLEADPPAHVFAFAMLESWGISARANAEWWGVWDSRKEFKAVAFAGDWKPTRGFGLVIPMGDPEYAEPLGYALSQRGGSAWVVGERLVSDAVWSGMGAPAPQVNSRQILMETTRCTSGSELGVRAAGLVDLAWVHEAAKQMLVDDLGVDPSLDDSVGFLRSVETSIASENEYIGEHDHTAVYRVKVDACGRFGAQIGGVWVPPEFRGRGHGQAGTRAIVQHLLQPHSRVTLHVRDDNVAAIRCYREVGFRPIRDFRLLVR